MVYKTIMKTFIFYLITIFFLGCEKNVHDSEPENIKSEKNIVEDTDNFYVHRPSFRLNQARLIFNGKVLMNNLNLSQNSFSFFFLWLKDGGLFAIGIEPLHISVPGGEFTDNQVLIDYEGYKIQLISQSKHIFDDFENRSAYLIHVPNFQMFGPGIRPSDLVVGAVSELKQIPGYSN